jgi:hypothetical protein
MSHQWILVVVIWLAYVGVVGAIGAASRGDRAVGSVAAGGLFAALIGTLLALAW